MRTVLLINLVHLFNYYYDHLKCYSARLLEEYFFKISVKFRCFRLRISMRDIHPNYYMLSPFTRESIIQCTASEPYFINI